MQGNDLLNTHMLMQELSGAFKLRNQEELKNKLGELCRLTMQGGDGSQEARNQAKKQVIKDLPFSPASRVPLL
jgi:hypothetical protein